MQRGKPVAADAAREAVAAADALGEAGGDGRAGTVEVVAIGSKGGYGSNREDAWAVTAREQGSAYGHWNVQNGIGLGSVKQVQLDRTINIMDEVWMNKGIQNFNLKVADDIWPVRIFEGTSHRDGSIYKRKWKQWYAMDIADRNENDPVIVQQRPPRPTPPRPRRPPICASAAPLRAEILLRRPCSPRDPLLEQASGPATASPAAREHPYRRACSTFARAACSASASAAARARGGGRASVEEQRWLGELEATESGGVWASSRRRRAEESGRAQGGGRASVEERRRLGELKAAVGRAWRSGGGWASSRRRPGQASVEERRWLGELEAADLGFRY
ncbi:hypothetical protein PR202_ga05418 [Eleusine coracana subsp. coracana]|uniref:Uncharacterized protein n=1 Tax=Eleusine coracana subsp. coracana TaxID=191504 RepID=A0AAV5BUS8_ELECO|nr:hypothetical protein PR202_ga04965 [Eleusine coracana subsp. coracana]GJM89247.1 hypothetical protein PR202_ga05418 [Eleusine coracana subsp. coracana]